MFGQIVTSIAGLFQYQKSENKNDLKMQREENKHEERMAEIESQNRIDEANAVEDAAAKLEKAGDTLNGWESGEGS